MNFSNFVNFVNLKTYISTCYHRKIVISHRDHNLGRKAEHGSEHEMKYAYLYHRASARRHFYTTNKNEKGIKCKN